jgi:hypothetical protein
MDVHTLACAAREIYAKHCRKAGRGVQQIAQLLFGVRIGLDETRPSVRWDFQIDPRASDRGGRLLWRKRHKLYSTRYLDFFESEW